MLNSPLVIPENFVSVHQPADGGEIYLESSKYQ